MFMMDAYIAFLRWFDEDLDCSMTNSMLSRRASSVMGPI